MCYNKITKAKGNSPEPKFQSQERKFEKNFKNYLTNEKKCDIIKSQKANSQTKTTALKGRKTKRYLLWQTS